MTERQWELYRLSVVQPLPESPYKHALISAIEHRLKLLDAHEAALSGGRDGSLPR
jgi:hypothetical protein